MATAIGLSGCGSDSQNHVSPVNALPPTTPTPTVTYTLGGTITGLESAGLVLSNGADTVAPAANDTSFSFSTGVAEGASYNVTVQTQPPLSHCTVSDGSGTMPASDSTTTVAVICNQNLALTTLHAFNNSDGSLPHGSLIQASDGDFYGVTVGGGTYNSGIVFKITSTGTLTTLHAFNGTDGQYPLGSLIQASDGNFYGTTDYGGTNNRGTVFKISSAGTLTTLHNFSGTTDGEYPFSSLIEASDGNFYGTTDMGGANNAGTIFKIAPDGTFSTLYDFSGGNDGAEPIGNLIETSDGNFYGMTAAAGAANKGTVFKITPSGTLTTLYTFNGGDGASPHGGLIQASDGNFYGMTSSGGVNNAGSIFKITPSGTLTALYSFNGSDGSSPRGNLVQASDGNFYGMTYTGGSSGVGTIFKFTSSGTLTTLLSFDSSNGYTPYGNLIQASDGNLYGITQQGGTGLGNIFQLAPQ